MSIAPVMYYVVEVRLAMVEEGAEVKAAVYPRVTCGAVAWHLAALRRIDACPLRCYNGKGACVVGAKCISNSKCSVQRKKRKLWISSTVGKHEICAPNDANVNQ